ncbi:hypothetical protein AALP_AA1G338500 [Arabis alpina]|uniref:TF-B3 domain-containing protein n=1 Tax=Arabis alpina TaxID=50452 RepID=A0A087HSF7_ARAAL|nr:hypothetical protein AALP_AA1G338500 [Arabis alpina]
MVLHLSDFGPSCYEVRELPAPNTNKNGYISMKKHLHPRTEEDDDQEDMERSRQKKAKKNNSEIEADSSSSSDHSCFVALVTASNLHEDALYLPRDFSSSNGFKRECCKICFNRWSGKIMVLDLKFNESSDSFYISRG